MTTPRNALRVLVVAADPLSRTGLAAILSDRTECEVVGQISGNDDLEPGLEAYRPDVIVWDVGWEPGSDLERLADLRGDSPPIVALLPDEDHALEAWNSGARGLLFRDVDADMLASALLAVSQGLTVTDPQIAPPIPQLDDPPPSLIEPLTPRETEVLALLAEGLANKTIAQRLNITDHTVKFHVNSILGKLDAQSRTEAVSKATRLGMVIL